MFVVLLFSVFFCISQDEVNQIVTSNVRLRQVNVTVEFMTDKQKVC